jgi:hypothetical protein
VQTCQFKFPFNAIGSRATGDPDVGLVILIFIKYPFENTGVDWSRAQKSRVSITREFSRGLLGLRGKLKNKMNLSPQPQALIKFVIKGLIPGNPN